MPSIKNIREKLSVLNPDFCQVIDESDKHVGHQDAGLGTHFRIQLSTNSLRDKSLIEKHRIVHNLLVDEFKNGLHALSIKFL